MSIDLRLGRYQEALADVERVDCLITDPPYSARTHEAQISAPRDPVAAAHGFEALEYACFTDQNAHDLVWDWAHRVGSWFVIFSDHALQRIYESALEATGFYVFAPLPQVTLNRSVRLAGDGPATWTTWITVARRKTRDAMMGARPGAYVDHVGMRDAGEVRGAKQLHLMRQIVRDYSRPGQTVVDPCAGGGTTLLAAAIEGRNAIGAEMDPTTFAKAQARLAKGYTPATLISDALAKAEQEKLSL